MTVQRLIELEDMIDTIYKESAKELEWIRDNIDSIYPETAEKQVVLDALELAITSLEEQSAKRGCMLCSTRFTGEGVYRIPRGEFTLNSKDFNFCPLCGERL